MGSVVPIVREKAFSPETVELMAEAYAAAKDFLPSTDADALETLAMRIITIAGGGERDAQKLAAAALAAFCASPPSFDKLVHLQKEPSLRSE
jgi:hypothetical protein